MPPKSKFTKEAAVAAALALVREEGMEALTARSLATRLGTSPKPLFGHFPSMEALRREVVAAAEGLYQTHIQEALESAEYPPYKASGMAYIRFAREEKALFHLLFMRDRSGEVLQEDRESIRPILELLKTSLGLSEDEAYLFHMEQWVYVHGIAAMIATGYLPWNPDFIDKSLTDVYQGLKHRFTQTYQG